MTVLPENLLLPRRTITGAGSIKGLAALAGTFGSRGLLVHGGSLERSGTLAEITATLPTELEMKSYRHRGGEPTVQAVDALRAAISEFKAEWVTAIGGGSVIDLAKAATGLADHPHETAFYQINPDEIRSSSIPLIAAPTTAGTGSEATVVSVLTNPERHLKQSIRDASHMPAAVILDPALLASCDSATITASGMDAFIQAFESYTSRYAVPFTSALAECAIEKIANNLLPFFKNPSNIGAATNMLEASYITGLAFSHSRLGLVHGLAHPLGVRFQAAHGIACACTLPAVFEFNRTQIAPHLRRLRANLGVNIEQLIDEWMRVMRIDNPFLGGKINDREAFIREVLASGSTRANPREVTADDLPGLIERITGG
jgi:alcohol dehydrogenase class IV